jgi:hypothetical protein
MKKRVLNDIVVESVSLIPAPQCAVCDARMVPHDALHWHCVRPSCSEAGKPVHTGGYPFFIMARDHPALRRVPIIPDPTMEPGTVELRSACDAFTCPRCKLISHNPIDKKEGFCAACGDFTRDHPDNPLPTKGESDVDDSDQGTTEEREDNDGCSDR